MRFLRAQFWSLAGLPNGRVSHMSEYLGQTSHWPRLILGYTTSKYLNLQTNFGETVQLLLVYIMYMVGGGGAYRCTGLYNINDRSGVANFILLP